MSWFLCYGNSSSQPIVTPPTASSTGDCDGAEITLNAGSSATTFAVTRAGDAAGQDYLVNAGQSTVVNVSFDATHSSVTVTAGGPALTTFSRDNVLCDQGDDNGNGNGNGGGNGNGTGGGNSGGATIAHPSVATSTSCGTGITVLLSNPRATAPVTFTLSAPDGTVTHVTVDPGQTATRSFAVGEDTTGVVTVAAAGLTTKRSATTRTAPRFSASSTCVITSATTRAPRRTGPRRLRSTPPCRLPGSTPVVRRSMGRCSSASAAQPPRWMLSNAATASSAASRSSRDSGCIVD